MKIVIVYGGGFAGETYTLQVDDKFYPLCTNGGGALGKGPAYKKAIDKLKELNIASPENIPFKWDGSM